MQSGLVFAVAIAALLQNGHASEVSIRMPYLNPAGVTYINHVDHTPLAYAHPAQFQYAAAAVPAKIEAQHVGYAAAQVPAVAAVPYIKHVPTVSHIPVTKFEAHPAVYEKQVDVVKPALSTRKIEVRRPGIQKQFYDIEQRVIVRPAGSAIVELDQPTSRQTEPAVIHSLKQIPHFEYPYQVAQEEPHFVSSTPAPQTVSSTPSSNGDESVVVENPDFRKLSTVQSQVRLADTSNERFIAHDPTPTVINSVKSTPEENQINQNKLIELLTARGNVAELGYSSGISATALGESGHLRTRVLSATPAPDNAEPTDERVSTRRIVFTKPIETLQQVNVVEPATKIERVSVQQPTLIKTARLDHVQVHGSVPVVGKALTPTLAHAAIPLYQKTISPAYEYYH